VSTVLSISFLASNGAKPPCPTVEINCAKNTHAAAEKTTGFPVRRGDASQILEWVRKSALKRAEARAPERGVYAASPGFALVSPVSNGRFETGLTSANPADLTDYQPGLHVIKRLR